MLNEGFLQLPSPAGLLPVSISFIPHELMPSNIADSSINLPFIASGLNYILFVKYPVARRLRDMFRLYVLRSFQVGDGSCQLDDARAGAGGQAHAVDDAFQDFTTFGRQRTILFYLTVVHCCIAENAFAG
jgi:hypothetical protein